METVQDVAELVTEGVAAVHIDVELMEVDEEGEQAAGG